MGLKGVWFAVFFLILVGCNSTCPSDSKICPDGTTVSRIGPECGFAPCPQYRGCTEEAKICPDGSSVSRIPPECNFPSCPEMNEECNYDDNKQYVSKNMETCSLIKYFCEVDSVPFSNECGCGCEPKPMNACSPEGKLCMDGTTVFRIGPECEFESCPEFNVTEMPEEVKIVMPEDNTNNLTINIAANTTVNENKTNQSETKGPTPEEEPENSQAVTCKKTGFARQISCLKIYDPVCGHYEPCEEDCEETFDNSCFACKEEGISYWTKGEC